MTYGLINVKRNVEDWKRYNMLGPDIVEKMKHLMRLFTPDEFYEFMEGVLCEYQLINYILFSL